MAGAKRKLNFGVAGTSKKSKGSTGMVRRRTASFAAKVKKVVLRTMETKRTNGYSNWNDFTHNTIMCVNGVAGSVAAQRNGMLNLLYSTAGNLARERDGKKIYVSHIDVQLVLQHGLQGALSTTYAYNARTIFRVIVYEADSTETAFGSTLPADVLVDPNLYYTTIGSGNSDNYLQRPVNTKYRVLKDTIVDIERDNVLEPESTGPDKIWAVGDQRYMRFRIPIKKNYEYEEVSGDSVCPHRTIQMIVIPWNNFNFGTTEVLGQMRCTHQMYFKDV